MIKNDGGGIYTYIGTGTPSSGQMVSDNIILVGKGYADGLSTPAEHAFGIYIDDRARDVEIKDNSVAECSGAGIYLHNAHEIEILNNTLYNNGGNNQVYGSQVLLVHDGYSPDDPIRNVVMHNNILFAKNKTQKILSFSTKDNDVELFGKSDYNYYYSPSENKIFRIWTEGWNGAAENLTFREWQIKTGQDSNTVLPPPALAEIFEWKMDNTLTRKGVITVGETEIYPDLTDIRFEYNPAMTTKVVPINDLYIDVKGNRYSKSVLIPPYKSLILIRLN